MATVLHESSLVEASVGDPAGLAADDEILVERYEPAWEDWEEICDHQAACRLGGISACVVRIGSSWTWLVAINGQIAMDRMNELRVRSGNRFSPPLHIGRSCAVWWQLRQSHGDRQLGRAERCPGWEPRNDCVLRGRNSR